MAQYWLDLSLERSDADILAELTLFINDTDRPKMTVVEQAGQKAVEIVWEAGGGGGFVLQWDTPGASTQQQIYARHSNGGTTTLQDAMCGPAGRINGLTYYAAGYNRNSDHRITIWDGGARTNLASAALFDASVMELHSTLDLDGASLIYTTEPTDGSVGMGTISATNSVLSEGHAGFGGGINSARSPVLLLALGVGTDGDPAPTGPVGGGPAPRRRPLIWVPY